VLQYSKKKPAHIANRQQSTSIAAFGWYRAKDSLTVGTVDGLGLPGPQLHQKGSRELSDHPIADRQEARLPGRQAMPALYLFK
jgi:hypothetical protein